jgi:hypothetical protein
LPHDKRQPSDENGGREDGGQSPQELPVGADAQKVAVLATDEDTEDYEDRESGEGWVPYERRF